MILAAPSPPPDSLLESLLARSQHIMDKTATAIYIGLPLHVMRSSTSTTVLLSQQNARAVRLYCMEDFFYIMWKDI